MYLIKWNFKKLRIIKGDFVDINVNVCIKGGMIMIDLNFILFIFDFFLFFVIIGIYFIIK